MTWSQQARGWVARVRWQEGGRQQQAWAGRHDDEVAAARAYNAKAREVLGPQAKLNELP